ncbi:MAG: putative lipid II flippase FtsW [Dehalococcoidia bacterium]|nr:putative lipid II flippase FtsW [Dehalococcoidia bacterium]MYI86232.1 putative lipid II flippase FtsW [Dehalococcoidia bacterium]
MAVTPNRRWSVRGPDYTLLTLIAVLTITGLVAVYSASFVIGLAQFSDSNHFIIRQTMWAVLGGVLLVAAMRTDYHILRRLAVPLMVVTLGLLLFTLILGSEAGGAQRWLTFGGFSLQPAEFAKLSVIVYLAAWLNARGDTLRSFEHGLMPFIIIISAIGLLLMLQPDLGTTGIILAITVTMFWAAGATFLQMSALFVSGGIAVVSLAVIEGYRLDRLSAFLSAESDPLGSGFQTLQSLIALGNGGATGLGLGASRGKFFYVPESHTDGIFAILGEELGLVATSAVVVLFVTLMLKGYQIARRAPDQFGFLLATGITTWIVAQAFVNIGGITRVIPLTGVPLPFLSYGGSALAAILLGAGVLASISRFTGAREAARERTSPGMQPSEGRDES